MPTRTPDNLNPLFLNPWPLPAKHDPQTHSAIQACIPEVVKRRWLSIDPIKGTQQTTINLLLKKLFTAYEQLSYTTADSAIDARNFVACCLLIDGRDLDDVSRAAIARIVRDCRDRQHGEGANARNVGRTDKGSSAEDKGTKAKRVSIPGSAGGGVRSGRSGGKRSGSGSESGTNISSSATSSQDGATQAASASASSTSSTDENVGS